jgi:NAD(P)-dependent dehydrogenase (short-subunit alcohol dehydrogenase family)
VFAGVRKAEDGDRLSKASPNITAIFLDVAKPDQIAKAIEQIRAEVGKAGLQGLINNAGIALAGPIEFLDMTELRRQHEVNFLAHVAVTQACLPLLRLGRGRVVNMSSISGRVTSPFLMPYSSSKFALEAFTDGLRRELWPWKLHVASVEPGAIATPIWDKSLETAEHARAEMPTQAEALYGPAMQTMLARAKVAAQRGVTPGVVARDVWHALTARRPRTRYAPGRSTALAIAALRLLPDSVVDWVLTRALYAKTRS